MSSPQEYLEQLLQHIDAQISAFRAVPGSLGDFNRSLPLIERQTTAMSHILARLGLQLGSLGQDVSSNTINVDLAHSEYVKPASVSGRNYAYSSAAASSSNLPIVALQQFLHSLEILYLWQEENFNETSFFSQQTSSTNALTTHVTSNQMDVFALKLYKLHKALKYPE
ncbi:hypothetical protein BE221DRAFT_142738 [Ostreococcus tauri]|uniref:Uncharacterized protein n=1 Tax=Ostreococcus tauri TaxID=70448 RepID=A0A1Y5HXK6_OSTTA|nr:hypothetical protein BE221DRAFT_142738 [Ostreococcus tauri]